MQPGELFQQLPDITVRILNYLESSGQLEKEDVEKVREQQLRVNKPISLILMEEELMDDEALLEALEHASGYPAINPLTYFEKGGFPLELRRKIPLELCLQYRMIPLQLLEGKIFVSMEDPGNTDFKSALQRELDLVVEPYIFHFRGIVEAIQKYYPKAKDMDLLHEMGIGEQEVVEEVKKDVGLLFMPVSEILRTPLLDILKKPLIVGKKNQKSPVLPSYMTDPGTIIGLVERVMEYALALRSTDIHIEPFSDSTRVRFRKDTVLFSHHYFAREMHNALVNRFKILAELNVAEHRRPQEATFIYRSSWGQQVNVRISVLPSLYGEVVELRILDGRQGHADINMLGMEEWELRTYLNNIRYPYGLILITGPTGSGKTTTLYSTLKILNNEEKRIITIEDPIEYHLYGVTQVQINAAVDLTYPKALRAFMRQDPDVIFLGEIREKESINTAIDASLTGHLVLSTLHTNDAVSAISRMLTTYECDPQLLSESLLMIVSQRLVRRLCTHCKEEYEISDDELRSLGIDVEELSQRTFWRGKGCDECGNTGFKGLVGVFEVMDIDAEIRGLIAQRAGASELYQASTKAGMRSLQSVTLRKCLDGETSLQELKRKVLHKASFGKIKAI